MGLSKEYRPREKIHAPATETLLQESKFQDGKQLEEGRRYYASNNSGLIF
jgi:hypothetical protein